MTTVQRQIDPVSASNPSGADGPSGAVPSKLPISVFIPTLNEEDRLPRCLRSLEWAEEVVVVDSGSTDGTVAVARELGARVVEHPWEGYSRQKEFALTQCRCEWALWLDADEEVSPKLGRSFRALFAAGPPAPSGFVMARRTVYLGKPLRFGGWYPDWKVRLFRKDRARFDGRSVHESAVVDGTVERVEGDLLHYSYRDLSHHMEKINVSTLR